METLPTKVISRTEIARRLGRTTTAVVNTLKRMKEEPVFSTGNFSYFDESIIPKIEKSMRAKNYNKRFATEVTTS